MLLGVASPHSVANVGGIAQGFGRQGWMVSPAAYVAAAAGVALVAVGIRWIRGEPEPPRDA